MATSCIKLLVLLVAFIITVAETSNATREGNKTYEFTEEYILNNWVDFAFTNNSDILSPTADINWCQGLHVSPIFSNNTILQRAPHSSTIFGYGTPQSIVSLKFNDDTYTSTVAINDANSGLGACSWRISLPPTDDTNHPNGVQRYNISITSNAATSNTIHILNVTFGDIWICAGQSNMWLPVQHTFSWYNTSINQSCDQYDIRFYHAPPTMALTPRDARQWHNNWQWYNADYINATAQALSAVCYYYARHLHDHLSSTVTNHVPIGLIDITQGGTIIEAWMSRAAQSFCDWRYCSNYDEGWGGATGSYYPYPGCNQSVMSANNQPGSLYNGMILPVSNFTIKGALWYQGENNGWTPGSYLKNQGYGCLLPRMIDNWRQTWYSNSNNNGLHKNEYNKRYNKYDINGQILPFGVVSLHSWCGEEASNCFPPRNYAEEQQKQNPTPNNLAWLRWAQVGSVGRVPNNIMSNCFVAQAYDLPDLGGDYGPPAQYEGGIHPRNKWTLSKRLALASLAIAYRNNTISYTGPVLSGCSVNYDAQKLILAFDERMLKGRNDAMVMKHNHGVEVQTSTSLNGWFDVNITDISGNNVLLDVSNVLNRKEKRIKRNLHIHSDAHVRMDHAIRITGVRYAWSDMPCCPDALVLWPQRIYNYTCQEAQCALYTRNDDLPAIPFIYKLNRMGNTGHCLINSVRNKN